MTVRNNGGILFWICRHLMACHAVRENPVFEMGFEKRIKGSVIVVGNTLWHGFTKCSIHKIVAPWPAYRLRATCSKLARALDTSRRAALCWVIMPPECGPSPVFDLPRRDMHRR